MDTELAAMPIIDIDTHYTKPRDLWTSRAPPDARRLEFQPIRACRHGLWDANNAKRGQSTPEKLKMEDTLCTAETAFPMVANFLFQPQPFSPLLRWCF